ncbi:MAG: GNAT family N-acetyltransferase [Proteobacteria bacterium]|nr:GNAT family N-acetyltransferase [Pseudomonadota bacterium]
MNETIRPGRDADAAGFIDLVRACWGEYPGLVFDLDAEVPELRALATYYAGQGGALWAADDAQGRLVGMIATRPEADGAWEICRVYLDRAHRGSGLAARLLGRAEAHATAAGATRLLLWSDTRFERAHRFYEKHSYVRSGPIRPLDDLSHSLEYGYAKPLAGIAVLDAAAAASAVPRLATLLVDCVAAGASVSFLAPLGRDVALSYWRTQARAAAERRRVLLAAWADGVLAGTVTLDLDMPANQPHRAEIKKLLVDPACRRRGLGRALLARAEAEAAAAGRSLLTLDTRADDAGEGLYRAAGWSEAGRIPDYSANADGSRDATVIFYRRLSGAASAAPAR